MEKADIELFKGKSFDELTSTLKEAKRDYLALIVMGKTPPQAVRWVGRTSGSRDNWRLEDPYFQLMEQYFLEHRTDYIQQVNDYFAADFDGIKYFLLTIARRIKDWDITELDKNDHKWAFQQLLKLLPKKSLDEGSYEDKLLKLREEKNAV